MTFLKWIAVFGMCMLITQLAYADDSMDEDDDTDDGLVENEPDENIVMEKMRYEPPQLSGRPFFAETFDDESRFKQRWTSSQAKKDGADENIAKYDGKWSHEEPKESALEGDMALVLKSKAKHHAVSAKLDRPFEFNGNPFIVSYEVKFQNGIECGGAYIKLLSKSNKVDLKAFHDKTPYTVMFGPDKCGLDYKMHFIFRHKNPKTGEFEEKHAKKPSGSIDKYFTDKKTHLYSLVINPDNSFEVLIDNKVINAGNLLEDMSPAVNPPKEIDDPNDSKPEEWDEREKIPDPEAIKPEDWDEDQPAEIADADAVKPDGWLDDEEALIPDPDADKPEDWDEEMDGEWEAPLIDNAVCKEAPGCGEWVRPSKPNPLFKGKWKAPLIENPNYKGEWKPQRITNPDWFEDLEPYRMTSIDSLGLELWSMTDEILFDNFMITDDKEVHASWVEQTWERKTLAESQSASGQGIWSTLMSAAELRPWLWAVYLVVLLLPIMLLSICLCPRSGPVKPEDIDAARKKTDEPSPDDEGQSGETETTEAAEEEVGASGDKGAKKGKKSKAALEKEDGGATGEESNAEGTEEEELDADEEEEETKAEKTTGSPRRSPRKRKSRKE